MPGPGFWILSVSWLDRLAPPRGEIDPGNTVVNPINFVSYPITHSLFGVLLWSLLFGGVYFKARRSAQSSLVLGALVLSHWVLDLIAHRPDLPLVPWSDVKVGMGLWNSLPLTVLFEGSLFALGALLYSKATRALNRRGIVSLWGLVGFLLVMYAMNFLGPPPPSVEPIGYIGLSQWLLIAWGDWIDHNRTLGLAVEPTT